MQFLTRVCFTRAASGEDPLRKREQFAVTLRKQKTKNIIAHKRRRLMQGLAN